MSYQSLATTLRNTLDLAHAPIALAIVDAPPAGVRAPGKRALSACSFWREAEAESFFASAEDHAGCAVGAHVMGFPLSAATAEELGGAITLMASVDYLDPNEVGGIPQVAKPGAGVVYGPLAEFPLAADCVLVWVTPAQAMLLTEALETTRWNAATEVGQRVFGRPGCGALARTVNTGDNSISLGCIGMRSFTEIAPALAFVTIPGVQLAALAEKLGQTAESNRQMLGHYQAKIHANA
jgi:uncharacterized protein (DUF169 family)